MKKYIVYVNGIEQTELITAGSLNAAEKKAQKKYPSVAPTAIQCVYTEI